jgi:glycerol-3-phosphate dehydrogenase (NAD(P)+)
MKTVTILGAGVMGSAMTLPFADRGMRVHLVGTHLDVAIIDSVQTSGRHPKLNMELPSKVVAFHHGEFATAVGRDTDVILLGVASGGVGWAIEKLVGALTRPIPVVMITKGMAARADRMAVFPDVVSEALESRLGFHVPVAAIGGPCIAGELAVRRQTGTVIVSRDPGLADLLCAGFATDYYHPRSSGDMIGVETCAAFKNFFAISVGWAHGQLELLAATDNKALNNNAAAILFDQAVREMMLLTLALGGSAESVWGMPGVGDLYVTCQAGRNSRLGHHLGRGLTYQAAKAGPMKEDTVEGAELGRSVAASLRALFQRGIVAPKALPLTQALLECLTEDTVFSPPWQSFHQSG